ncbi:hypothetical protein HPT25_23570 [Bacillus sp. BRMEA1]|uniref:hypothetical protein n=1 Tax=Neobacillus endophyticus TaxID=2738405 RepID=UPI0015659934|nr:hypothetical protein [Neobacillus endophyticus]NRD80305.1 hypothetical protein [Neobacillus endophyticus]
MNDKIPTFEESKNHIETLVKFGLDLDERHYKKFLKPVFDKIEEQQEKINVALYELTILHEKVNPSEPSSIDRHFKRIKDILMNG